MKKVILYSLLFIFLLISNAYPQWVQTMAGNDSVTICCLADNSNTIFGGALSESVFYSGNNGASWTQSLYMGYLYYSTIAIAANGNNIFSVAVPSSVFGSVWRSTNNGHNWEGTTLNDIPDLTSLTVQGGYIIAGAYGGVHRSNDNGITWTNSPIANNTYIHCLTVDGANLYAGTNHGIYASFSYGASWFSIGLDSCIVYSIAAEGSNIFAGIESPYFPSGVFRSTNYGANWTRTSLPNYYASSIVISGENIIAAVNSIYLSKDNGVNWILKNEGFPYTPAVLNLLIRNNYIYAATLNYPGTGSVWRRELSEIIGIQTISTETPYKYSLSQNYPNPFNPSTTLRFSIPKPSSVKITVYDILGKEIETLINSRLQSGTYTTNWNASQYPSGIYFCRMNAREQNTDKTGTNKEYKETIKMSLLK